MSKRSWTLDQLKLAVKDSISYRQVLIKLNLVEAGGNYSQIKKYIQENDLDIKHFKGRAWLQGLPNNHFKQTPLEQILIKNSSYQSHKLKLRLFKTGLKEVKCEECGWNKKAVDGRIPLELDHINGNKKDNRLENIRILCPNCHSLKSTHRGLNSKKARVL